MIAMVVLAPVPMSVTPTKRCAVPSGLTRMVAAPKPGPERITAQRHADAVLLDTAHGARLMPFFVPADALRPLDDALVEIVRREGNLALVLLNAVAHEHVERD